MKDTHISNFGIDINYQLITGISIHSFQATFIQSLFTPGQSRRLQRGLNS